MVKEYTQIQQLIKYGKWFLGFLVFLISAFVGFMVWLLPPITAGFVQDISETVIEEITQDSKFTNEIVREVTRRMVKEGSYEILISE